MFPGFPVFAFVSWVLAVATFVAACVITASDAQGAFVFIFALPLLLLFLGAAFAMSGRKSARLNRITRYGIGLFSVYLFLFFLSAVVPTLQFVARGSVEGISRVFEAVTGKTPYAFFRTETETKD